MPEKLALEIVTPERRVFSEAVDKVILPSVEGYMGVLYGHTPLLAQLDVGEITYRIGSTEKYFAVSGGFAEVLRDKVSVLAESCEPAHEIDVERAKRSRDEAEAAMKSDASEVEFERAEIRLERAVSRIRIHERGLG